MDLKEFFKPTLVKIIIFIILMAGLNYWIISNTHVMDARILVGAPLGFYPIGSFMIWDSTAPPPPSVEFSYVNLIIDLIFWYIISCLLVAWYKSTEKWRILLLLGSSLLVVIFTIILVVNLSNGRWGISTELGHNLFITALIAGLYTYLLKRTKLFGLNKK
jgi:hypothetical protein